MRLLPTVAVMTVLAGLGYWGHHTGWTIPKYSELAGSVVSAPDDWCEEHGVPESICVECNPDEYPQRKLHGWCKVHGIHECPLHYPDVAQLKDTPQIEQHDLYRASKALDLRPRLENNFASPNPGTSYSICIARILLHKQEWMSNQFYALRLLEVVTGTGEIRYDQTRVLARSRRSSMELSGR